jgi:hypothetical protein
MLQKCSKLLAAAAILMGVIGVPLKVHADGPAEYNPDVCASDTEGKDLSQACADMIKAFPKPDFEQVEQDKVTLDHYSFWKVGNINTATDLYDKPNGAVVGQIP